MVLPELAAAEHGLQQAPVVPEVVGDAPHVGVLLIVPRLLHHGGAGGQGEDHGPSRLGDGPGEHLHLMLPGVGPGAVLHQVVGVADVVALDEIHAPGGVELDDGIVIRLPGLAVPQAVHIRVPAAHGGGVRRQVRRQGGPLDLPMGVGGGAGDTPHDMDAEFQPQAVDVLRQRGKAPASLRGGEPLRVRQEAGIFVHLQHAEGNVLKLLPHGAGPMGVPLDIHHHVLPAEGTELLRHHLGIGADLGLGDGGVVVVVAVPPHGRGEGALILVHRRSSVSAQKMVMVQRFS